MLHNFKKVLIQKLGGVQKPSISTHRYSPKRSIIHYTYIVQIIFLILNTVMRLKFIKNNKTLVYINIKIKQLILANAPRE